MGFYEQRILPYLIHVSMRQEILIPYRRRLVQSAKGRVLEIGVGSGLNLPLYTEDARHVIGLDPSPKLLSMARETANRTPRAIELLEASAEAIPLEDNSVDTVVTTWTLCSIPHVIGALRDVRRVLKTQGHLLFAEHGRSPDRNVSRWQDRLTPLWKHIAGGCHLNRPVDQLLGTSGFTIERMETGYMEGPKMLTFMYEGCARVT